MQDLLRHRFLGRNKKIELPILPEALFTGAIPRSNFLYLKRAGSKELIDLLNSALVLPACV